MKKIYISILSPYNILNDQNNSNTLKYITKYPLKPLSDHDTLNSSLMLEYSWTICYFQMCFNQLIDILKKKKKSIN